MCDLLQLEKSLPTVSHFREFDLSHLRKCRDGAAEKIAWPILFIKAYAVVAAKHPALRQSWRALPNCRLLPQLSEVFEPVNKGSPTNVETPGHLVRYEPTKAYRRIPL